MRCRGEGVKGGLMTGSEKEERVRRLKDELLKALRSGDIELRPEDLKRTSLVKMLRRKMKGKAKYN